MGRIKERGYLLFMYGKFKNDEKVQKILHELSPVISTDIKFTWGDYGIVAHFASKMRFVELQDFVFAHISGNCEQYFLTEKTDKLSVHGSNEIISHLFGLEVEESKIEHPLPEHIGDIEKLNEFLEFFVTNEITQNPTIFDLTDDDDEDEDEIKKIISRRKSKPTLDELLEKIQNKGIKSLSSQEKKLLDEYSNGN